MLFLCGRARDCRGFVDGRTQTIYPWDSWDREYTGVRRAPRGTRHVPPRPKDR